MLSPSTIFGHMAYRCNHVGDIGYHCNHVVTSPDENNNIKKVYSQVQGDAYGTNTNVVEVKIF